MKNAIGSVFISHSSREPDFSVTKSLAESLESIGVNIWWDKEGLEGGDNFSSRNFRSNNSSAFFCFYYIE